MLKAGKKNVPLDSTHMLFGTFISSKSPGNIIVTTANLIYNNQGRLTPKLYILQEFEVLIKQTGFLGTQKYSYCRASICIF